MSNSKYRVNWKFLGVVVVVLAAVAVGTHLRYRQQVGSQAGVLIQLADAAEAKGELGKAVSYLRRYLVFAPADTDARARFGLLMTRQARSQQELLQSYMVLDEVLRRDDTRYDVRRRAAELALVVWPQLQPDAERHLKELVKTHPEDGEVWALYAEYHLLRKEWKLAVEKLTTATDRKPDLYSAYAQRALIRRDHLNEPAEEADKDIEAGLFGPAANRQAATAHLVAAGYWKATGREELHMKAIEQASQLAPDDLEVILTVSGLALTRGSEAVLRSDAREAAEAEWSKARSALQRGIDLYAASVGGLSAEAVATLVGAEKLRRLQVGELFQRLVRVEVLAGNLANAEQVADRGVKLMPESAALQLAFADVHIRKGQFDQATTVLNKLEQTNYSKKTIDYHRGRILAGKGQWRDAAKTLEAVLFEKGLPAEVVETGSILLGTCYEQLGEIDRRYAVYTRAAAGMDPSDPLWATVNQRLAAILVEMGQETEAIKVYERLTERLPGANGPLGRLLLARTLRKPRDQRDWTRVEQVVQTIPDGPDAAIIRADLQIAQGKVSSARDTLVAATKKHPDAVSPWVALAQLEHRDRKPDRAREALESARGKFGPTVEIRLTEARLLTFPPTPQTAAGLSRLAEGVDKLPERDGRRLLRGLSEYATAAGDPDLATRFLERLTALAPEDLQAHLARFDDALRRKDDAAAQALLKRIQDIDAPGGTTTQAARAIYLVWKAQTGDRSQLPEAEELLTSVRRQRPWWTRAILAQALMADLKGDSSSAAAKYREAVDAGERNPDIVQRLLQLYGDRQQYREAEEVLDKLHEGSGVLAGNDLLVSELSARAGNLKRALEAAERSVSAAETDPRKLLWLSHLRRLTKEPAEQVEQPLRRAVQVAGDRPGPWVALVQFLVATNRKPEAEKQTREAERRLGDKHHFAIAQCYEAVGDIDRAGSLYASALKDQPGNVAILRGAAGFYLRSNDPDQVKKLCEMMMAVRDLSAEDRQFAVRLLGVVVTAGGDYQATRRTLESLGILQNGIPTRLTGQESVTQLRTRGVVLSVQGDAQLRREAIDAFERIEARQPLAPDDQFLLARLLVSVGEWPKARVRLGNLVRANASNLFYASFFGFAVLQYDGDTGEARRCLELMDKTQPESPRTVELKARVLAAEGKRDDAAAAIEGYLARDAGRLAFASQLLERLGMADRAEPLYRKLASDPKQPNAVLALASFLGRQGKTGEALSTLRGLIDKVSPAAVASVGVEVLYHAHRVEPDDVRQVETWIKTAAGKGGNGSQFLGLTAIVRMAEGRYADAIRLYREIISSGTPDPLAMNNLGYLLATHEHSYDEALQWVRKAREVAGPRPTFVDTEALILIRSGEAQKAVDLLADVTKESPDPAAFFHLALAHQVLNNRVGEAAAIRQAKRWNIRPIDVPPPERKQLVQALATAR